MADPPVSEPTPPGRPPLAVGHSTPAGQAPQTPEANPRRRVRSAMLLLVIAWLAAIVAAGGGDPRRVRRHPLVGLRLRLPSPENIDNGDTDLADLQC